MFSSYLQSILHKGFHTGVLWPKKFAVTEDQVVYQKVRRCQFLRRHPLLYIFYRHRAGHITKRRCRHLNAWNGSALQNNRIKFSFYSSLSPLKTCPVLVLYFPLTLPPDEGFWHKVQDFHFLPSHFLCQSRQVFCPPRLD